MAQLVVRNLEAGIKLRLQRRAKRHGRSMEEEVRDILRDAAKEEATPARGLGTEIASLFRKGWPGGGYSRTSRTGDQARLLRLMIILDTNVLSALMSRIPDKQGNRLAG